MTQLWTIVAKSDGAVLCPAFVTQSTGQHPKDKGWDWDAATQHAVRIAIAPDPLTQRFDGTQWSDDPASLEPLLIASVKAEAEQRKTVMHSPGSGKAAEYQQKRAEAHAAADMPGATLDALPMAVAVERYPAAAVETQLSGEELSVVLRRYLVAAAAADQEIYRLSAIEQWGTAAIKAASTATAKRAAAASIDWAWRHAS